MPETRFTEFPALPVVLGLGRLFCIGDRCLINFLNYDIKNYYLSFLISFLFEILRRIATFYIRCFPWLRM